MNKIIGIGVIGCGNVSSTYFRLAPLFRGIEILACADLDAEAARNQGAEFEVQALEIESLLDNSEIEIVLNLTVPEAHFKVSQAILEAGKYVYSEKPLTQSLEEGTALKELADSKGLQIACAPDTFLGGVHQQARDLIDSGTIGKITGGTCHVLSYGMEHWHPNPDFFFKPGGGPMLDLGPYYIGNLIHLIGPVKRVTAFSSIVQKERTISSEPRCGEKILVETPTTIHAILEFASGALVTLGCSWDIRKHEHHHIELYGSEGSLIIPDPNFFGGELRIFQRSESDDGEFKSVPEWEHPLSVANEEHDSGMRANYRAVGLADFARAIQESGPYNDDARCAIERPLHGVDVMTSILKSAELGRAIDLKTTCTRPQPLTPQAAKMLIL